MEYSSTGRLGLCAFRGHAHDALCFVQIALDAAGAEH